MALVIFHGVTLAGGTVTTIKTRIRDLRFTHDFENGYPTDATQELLFNEFAIFLRQVAGWRFPNIRVLVLTRSLNSGVLPIPSLAR